MTTEQSIAFLLYLYSLMAVPVVCFVVLGVIEIVKTLWRK